MSGVTNPVKYSFGQLGSIHAAGTETISCIIPGRVFVAITFLEDTKFDTSSSGAFGLVPDENELYPSSAYNSTDIDLDGGDKVSDEVFSKGITIYGRWTGFKLAEGRVIAYIGA